MRVLLIELAATGHHVSLYLKCVVDIFEKHGVEYSILTTENVAQHPSFCSLRKSMTKQPMVFLINRSNNSSTNSTFNKIKNQYRLWRDLKTTFETIKTKFNPDSIYIPYLDEMLIAFGALGSPFRSTPVIALQMDTSKLLTQADKSVGNLLRHLLLKRVLSASSVKKVLTIDNTFYRAAQLAFKAHHDKLAYLPDFSTLKGASSPEQCRATLSVSPEAHILLVYGAISLRKGVEEALNALCHPDAPKNLVLLIAGKQSKEVENLLLDPKYSTLIDQGRVLVRNWFHDPSEEYSVFRSANSVWLGYRNVEQISSGVLLQAIMMKLPVLAPSKGRIAELTYEHQIGICVDPRDKAALVEALHNISSKQFSESFSAEPLRRYAADHTPEEHGRVVLTTLMSREVNQS